MVDFKEPIKKYYRALPWITLKEFLMIIVSTIPYALTVNQLLVPHAIVGGGVTGLCEIIYFATNTYVPIWLSNPGKITSPLSTPASLSVKYG